MLYDGVHNVEPRPDAAYGSDIISAHKRLEQLGNQVWRNWLPYVVNGDRKISVANHEGDHDRSARFVRCDRVRDKVLNQLRQAVFVTTNLTPVSSHRLEIVVTGKLYSVR